MNFLSMGTNNIFLAISAVITLLFTASVGSSSAYDSPNFDFHLFSPEGLFLDESDQTALLGALTSIAVDFPNDELVDSDLREKAIALAMRISPLDANLRAAHQDLMAGKKTIPSQSERKPGAIALIIWKIADKLISEN